MYIKEGVSLVAIGRIEFEAEGRISIKVLKMTDA